VLVLLVSVLGFHLRDQFVPAAVPVLRLAVPGSATFRVA